MKSSGKYPLTGTIHVDEFYVGGKEEGVIGRSKGANIVTDKRNGYKPLKKDYLNLEQKPLKQWKRISRTPHSYHEY